MYGPPETGVGDDIRRTLTVRKRFGPPRPVEEPRVPEDLAMLVNHRDPLIDRLDKVRNSTNLQLSQFSRDALDEAMAVLHRLGWDR